MKDPDNNTGSGQQTTTPSPSPSTSPSPSPAPSSVPSGSGGDGVVVVEDVVGGSGVFVSVRSGVLSGSVELRVVQVVSGEDFDLVKATLENAVNDADVAAVDGFLLFDISLVDGDEVVHLFGGEKITVSIPVPEGYDGARCRVYFVDDDGVAVDMNAELVDGYLVFDVDHLSLYVVVQISDSQIIDDDNNANVGAVTVSAGVDELQSGGGWYLWLAAGVAVVAVLLGVLLLSRRGKNGDAGADMA